VYILLFSILKNCEGETEWVSNRLIGCRGCNDSFLLEGLVKRLSYDITADVFGKIPKS